MSQRRRIKKEKGIALLLTLMILIALSTMSIAMLSIIQTSAKNTARSHLSVITYQAAEAGIEEARIDLMEEIIQKKKDTTLTNNLFLNRTDAILTDAILGDIDPLDQKSKSCLALHGYIEPNAGAYTRIYYALASNNIQKWDTTDKGTPEEPFKNAGYAVYDQTPLAFSTDPSFKDYTFVYFVQRVPVDATLAGYNFITQGTYSSDSLVSQEILDNQRLFYRIISCGFSPPGHKHIVPLQAYYSTGGKIGEPYFIEKNLILTGSYRP
jgi:hypothetical protein